MMKKILSVALSVIMVLSLIAVPGLAADPMGAVEYTVSEVSYSGQVRYYDEENPEADTEGYVTKTEAVTSVPENGLKLIPSVDVSASAASQATVVFAVYTAGVLTNAFYETKAVGTEAVTFTKDITVADSAKETYSVYVLGADGKAVAPASNFPAVNANLAYAEITYADSEVETYYGIYEEDKKIDVTLTAEQIYTNPTIKVVPECNTSVVDVQIADSFALDGATFTITALDGTKATYTIKPTSDSVKPPFISYETKVAMTGNGNGTGTAANNYKGTSSMYAGGIYKVAGKTGKIVLAPEMAATPIEVKVPYGTEKLLINESKEVEILTTNGTATTEITEGGVTYTLNISWKPYNRADMPADAPLVYDFKYNFAGKQALVKAADGSYLNYYYAMPTRLTLNEETDFVFPDTDLMKKDGSGVLYAAGKWTTEASHQKANLATHNNGASINRLHIASWSFESWVTAGELTSKYDLDGATMFVVHYKDGATTSPRYEFKAAVDGVVYAAYTDKGNTTLTATEGWTRVSGAEITTMNKYSGTLTATEAYAIPSTKYIEVYKKTVSAGDSVAVKESGSYGEAPPIVIVASADMLNGSTTPDEPGTGGGDEPGTGGGDEPVVPPTPSTAKLASVTYTTQKHAKYSESTEVTTAATQAWADDATEYVVEVPMGTGVVTVSAAADHASTPNTLAGAVTVDMAGSDEKTAEILGNTVKFVWDDTNPYIYDVEFPAAFSNRWGIDFGTDGKIVTETDNSGIPKASSTALSSYGVSVINERVVGIPMHSAIRGMSHMAASNFNLISKTYAGTDASNSALSFRVSEDATVYTRAIGYTKEWEELEALGWTADGTIGSDGYTRYKQSFSAGELVTFPGTPIDDADVAAYNESNTETHYIKYAPNAELATTTATKTQKELWDDAGASNTRAEGAYLKWSWDATANKPVAPILVETKTDPSHIMFPVHPIFYVQFAEPAAPATLASYTVSTEKDPVHQDVAAVTGKEGTFTGTDYTVVVPVGTKTATATIKDSYDATANVTVNFEGMDSKTVTVTVAEKEYTVKFVWDDAKPYIYNTKIRHNADRLAVQYGYLASDLKPIGKKTNAPDGTSLLSVNYVYTGVPAPGLNDNTVVFNWAGGTYGQPHMLRNQFDMIYKDYPATSEATAFASFNVGAEGTIYVRSMSPATWLEMEALVADTSTGWYRVVYDNEGTPANATIKDPDNKVFAVYAKDVEKGDAVYIPGFAINDEFAAAYNAYLEDINANIRYVKYNPDQSVTTTNGPINQKDAFVAAGCYKDAENTTEPNGRIITGDWYEWGWDNAQNQLTAPIKYRAVDLYARMLVPTYPVVYGIFGETEVPPVDPTPEEPPVDNSANELALTYTTALAVTSPKATNEHINGKNRIGGANSIYAGGFYMPTLVSTAANAVVDHEAKTAVVTVPFGTEVVNLTAATVAGTAIDLTTNASIAMLNDNGATKSFEVVAGTATYAVTVKWADASDAILGIASTGADIYGMKYKYADLWGGAVKAYKIIPTTLDLSYNLTIDAAYYEAAGQEVPTQVAKGVHYASDDLFKANMTAMNSKTDYGDLARYKIAAESFIPWVNAGIIADVDDLDGATLVNTGVHYQTSKDAAEGANAEMTALYEFNVEAAGVVYVSPSAKGAFNNDGTWTAVSAETWLATRSGNNSDPTFVIIAHSNGVAARDVVYVKNVEAGDLVSIPVTLEEGDFNPIVIYDAGATFTAPADPEPTDPEPTGDIEDTGIKAVVADDVNTTQDAGSSDVSISGSGAEHAEMVAVYVLAEGKSMSDLLTAIGTIGSGDLVASGIVMAMGQTWADENGNFTIHLTLPDDAASTTYDVAVITEDAATEVEDGLEFVKLADKVAVYNAIVGAANASDMATAFANVGLVINTGDIYNGFNPADQALIQSSALNDAAVDALPAIADPVGGEYTGLENLAKLAEIIDARVAAEVLNNGASAAEFDQVKAYLLPAADANSANLSAVAHAIYAGDALNANGKAAVLAAITNRGFEVTSASTIKELVAERFEEAAFIALVNDTAYTNANNVLPLVQKYETAGVLVATGGVAMNEVTKAALTTLMKDYEVGTYEGFANAINKITTPAGEGELPGAGTGEVTGGVGSSSVTPSNPDPVPTKKLLSDFTDANQAAWAATALQTMLDRNILSGYEDNTIRPNNSATRQEVAKMLVEAFSAVRPYAWTGFSDVPAGSWYYSYVATAAEDGIIKGVGEGNFGTDANITREDLSVLIYRFLVNKGIALNTAATKNFADAAAVSDYAVDAINALTNAGIVKGYDDGSYNPKGNATRAEIAQIIANVIVIYAL